MSVCNNVLKIYPQCMFAMGKEYLQEKIVIISINPHTHLHNLNCDRNSLVQGHNLLVFLKGHLSTNNVLHCWTLMHWQEQVNLDWFEKVVHHMCVVLSCLVYQVTCISCQVLIDKDQFLLFSLGLFNLFKIRKGK